ncbi:MAG: hypothetical protein ABL999_00970 [Pyrinomonadaceae bacterium]
MNSPSQSNNSGFSHLVALIGGFGIATWAARESLAESKKSRAELDRPEEAEEAFEEISEILDGWEPVDCETEGEYTHDLADYLTANTEFEIEICPTTEAGCPDILINDLIALELKVSPNKNERNRCIGQCAHYSRLWITWMVMIDLKPSKAGRLEEVLKDKGLEHILVWNFT